MAMIGAGMASVSFSNSCWLNAGSSTKSSVFFESSPLDIIRFGGRDLRMTPPVYQTSEPKCSKLGGILGTRSFSLTK